MVSGIAICAALPRKLYLEGQVMVFLLLLGPQRIPPFAQDLADCPVVLIWMPLMHQGPVPLAEDHESVHWPPYVVFFSLPKQRGYSGH